MKTLRALLRVALATILLALPGCAAWMRPPVTTSALHPGTWMEPGNAAFHGAVVKAAGYDYTRAQWSGTPCVTCHAGASASQTSPVAGAPNCFSCHAGGPDGSAGHPAGWTDPANPSYHGQVVVAAGRDYTQARSGNLTCNTCHAGASPTQASVNSRAPNCFACHAGGPDGSPGHPAGWAAPPSPTYHGAVVVAAGRDYAQAKAGGLTCNVCHAGASPSQASPNAAAPSCFACHVGGPDGSAAHPPGWTDNTSGPFGDVLNDPGFVPPGFSHYRLVVPERVVVGDAVRLRVEQVLGDGTITALPGGSLITWLGPDVLVASATDSALPPNATTLLATDSPPTGFFARNPARTDHRVDLLNTLFIQGNILATGSVTVEAVVSGGGIPDGRTGRVTIAIDPMPAGIVSAGALQYAANCAACHGTTGQGGGIASPDAPGLNNASPGGEPNVAADPAWSPALLAFASRADIDNAGLTLALPMVNWLTLHAANGQLLTTQDFADIWAWLKTQS